MISIGMLVNERYEIIEKIGTGGMSVVYKARCTVLERFVAIKILREEFCLDQDFVKKFKVEAQSAASLSHNNIVKIYDVGNDGRIHFIVMEYLKGITLKEYIHQKGYLEDTETMKIAARIAYALEHAHDNKIIHRDIKPQNIMITDDGNVKVMDFGIARIVTEATIVANDMTVGSVHYIAPEQARGSHVDEKNDIYSLGITMYEMVTGKVPFDADTAVSIALKHINDELPAMQEKTKNPKISTALEQIIMKATRKKVSERYQSANDLLKDLKKAANFPNSEFVEITTVDHSSPTIILSEDEVRMINKKAEKKKNKRVDRLVVLFGSIAGIILALAIGLFAFNYVNKSVLPKEVEIPKVIEMSMEDADIVLANNMIEYEVLEEQYNEEVEAGSIISQSQLGTVVKEPNEIVKINLVVSKGVELFEVPAVLNMEYNQAKLLIKNKGLNLVEMETEYHDTVLLGDVFMQEPEAGEMVTDDTVVTIYVSGGKEEVLVTMPDIKNLTEREGINKLENSGLSLGNITYVDNEIVPKGSIITTNVEVGTEVAEGYIVNIVVSEGKSTVTKRITVNDILPNDQDSGLIEVYFIDNEGNESVIFQSEVTRRDLPLIIEVEGKETGIITVYLDGVKEFSNTINFAEVSN